ncbi:MAG: DNA topoisomerase VI subunit B [Candidatus Aenigmatarchaeota archaeon]
MAETLKKTAEEFAKEQKEISISEFFEKNKHLLGFDNPTKALLMAVKEAVDNSIDAGEEAGILPDIIIKVKNIGGDKFRVSVQDDGPGIVKEQVPKIFGKLLYGSKFHRLRQSRGQQGIGISAVLLYSQLTTGNPTRVWSKTSEKTKTYYCELFLNTAKNEPEIVKEEFLDKDNFSEGHGLRVEMDILGRYRKVQGIDDYLKQTSIANPFVKIIYSAPDGTKTIFQRSTESLPKPPKEIKLHPYGVEFGILQRFLIKTNSKTLQSFLTNEFSSIGSKTAKEICKVAKLNPNLKPNSLTRDQIEKLLNAMQNVKVQRPPLDCLSPIGEKDLEKSLKKEYPEAEFVCTVTREPSVYRGNPFQIEVGIVYGVGKQDSQIEVFRFANRVPLMYQAGACAITEAVKDIDWKRYGLQQSGNNIPIGPMILVVHMASVWVPFISESKEAIAPYPEIVKEMKLALQDAGRKLLLYLSGKRRAGEQKRRLQIFERYAGEVAQSLSILTGRDKKDIEKKLKELIEIKAKIKDSEEEIITKDENSVEVKNKKTENKKFETKKENKEESENEEE